MDFSLSVSKLQQRTANVVSLFLDAKGQNIPYQAGQFFRLTFANVQNDPRGPSRFFSNSASPTERDFFLFTTTISPSPFKQKVKTLQKDETVSVSGPFGKFVLGDSSKPYLFMSGGIGITPFRSMLKYATDEKLPHKITLLNSNKVPQDIIFREDFDEIARTNPNVKIIYTITRPEESKTTWQGHAASQNHTVWDWDIPNGTVPSGAWQGRTGRIDGKMIKECITDIPNTLFYICGPPSMVESLATVVKDLGVPEENLKSERFTGYQ